MTEGNTNDATPPGTPGGEGTPPDATPPGTPGGGVTPAAHTSGAPDEFVEQEAPKAGVPYPLVTFNREKWREIARVGLAYGLWALLAATVLIIVIAVTTKHLAISDAKDLLENLLAPLVGLVGAATGFYFAGKDN